MSDEAKYAPAKYRMKDNVQIWVRRADQSPNFIKLFPLINDFLNKWCKKTKTTTKKQV